MLWSFRVPIETLPTFTPQNPIIHNSVQGNLTKQIVVREWVKWTNWKLLSLQINTCYTVPCASTGENECLWTDWLLDNSLNGEQARQYACIRRSDTTCSWYRGGSPPEKDFLDMTDPWLVILMFILNQFYSCKSNTSCFCFCSSNVACTDIYWQIFTFKGP